MTTEKDIYNEQIEEEKLEIITEYIEERSNDAVNQ